ncbi:MAG TPA: hypothetical protein VL381_05610 [Rhodocyclaceae bacterium]|jgi:hypothetical protein|nr:hypothetical protein [Rhodocyclaceae bacterium]
MNNATYRHAIQICSVIILGAMLSACSTAARIPHSPSPSFTREYPASLKVAEPGPQEVVVVVNDNIKMNHAGMFAGSFLLDPAGSYKSTRQSQADWLGISLQDYIRFQLEDGPDVQTYRFQLSPDHFAAIKARVDAAGGTMPLFCAAKVQNILSGLAPFESVPNAWLVLPATVAKHLDEVIAADQTVGSCNWPDGSSCYSEKWQSDAK